MASPSHQPIRNKSWYNISTCTQDSYNKLQPLAQLLDNLFLFNVWFPYSALFQQWVLSVGSVWNIKLFLWCQKSNLLKQSEIWIKNHHLIVDTKWSEGWFLLVCLWRQIFALVDLSHGIDTSSGISMDRSPLLNDKSLSSSLMLSIWGALIESCLLIDVALGLAWEEGLVPP